MSRTKAQDVPAYTIMIVDDIPANLGVLIDHLEDHGYRIVIAQDSLESLKRAELVQPDLILLDVMMPGIDGFETCRRLKTSERTKDIPVIFITSLTDTSSKIKGFEVGGIDFINKPIQLDDLLARIKTHLALRCAQKQVEAKNARLESEIAMREEAEAALQIAHRELEQRIAERTVELVKANTSLKAEIAERERVEAALRESQTLLQALIDNSKALIYVKDLEGRFLLVNNRYKELFHITNEEVSAKTDDDIFPSAHAEALRASDKRVLETCKPLEVEEVMPQDDGLHTYISTKCPLFDAAGKPYAVCGISTDITERTVAEQLLHDKLAIIEQQREQIRTLATPVIQVWDRVLMMAVFSTIDARTAAQMMDVLLHAVVRTRSRFTILDLTAVEVLDRETADHLVALVGAVRLLGAEGIVVGIRPEVARTLAGTGSDLRAIRTLANLRDALLVCMRHA
jgi:PAS domain S-box-containing protein